MPLFEARFPVILTPVARAMALMYPYSVYDRGTRRNSQTSDFSEDNPRYHLCWCHVGNISTVLTSLTLAFCVISVGFCAAGIIIPDSHRYMNNRHINLEFESQPAEFRLFYNITLAVLLAGSSVHLLTSILCLAGIRLIRPNLIVPELIVTGLFVGLILFATISITICMIILLGFLWFLTLADGILIFYATFHFYSLLLTYKYVRDKRRYWSMASSRPRLVNNYYNGGVGKNVYFSD